VWATQYTIRSPSFPVLSPSGRKSILRNRACIGAHLERLFAGSKTELRVRRRGHTLPRYTDGRYSQAVVVHMRAYSHRSRRASLLGPLYLPRMKHSPHLASRQPAERATRPSMSESHGSKPNPVLRLLMYLPYANTTAQIVNPPRKPRSSTAGRQEELRDR
jgi:hypothetical protein